MEQEAYELAYWLAGEVRDMCREEANHLLRLIRSYRRGRLRDGELAECLKALPDGFVNGFEELLKARTEMVEN